MVSFRGNPLNRIRADICRATEIFFGRPVAFEERAFQALEVVTRKGHTANAVHVWSFLAESLPAINLLYETLGIDFKGVPRPWPKRAIRLDPRLYDTSAIDWIKVLRSVFCVQDAVGGEPKYTETCDRIIRQGEISAGDLATGILQSGRISRARGRISNLVLRALARAANLQEAVRWSAELKAFSSKATACFADIYACDPSCGNQQFILYYDGQRYRVAPFGVFGAYQLEDSPLPDGSLWVARGNLIQPTTRFAIDAISYLESLINAGAKEVEFQRFFEEYPEFLLALGDYVCLHPQIVLTEDDGGRLIPDFFLEKINSAFCDICDLKGSTADLVRYQRHRSRFRDAVMEAVAQLNYYRDWFEDREHRESFHRIYGLRAYRPRVVVIIGRRHSYYDEVERIRLESELPGWVLLRTYDEVVENARRWKRLLTA